jgi:hypothetical protein
MSDNEIKTETKPFNVWSFTKDISEKKEYLYDDTTENDYIPFTINRSFSSHIDALYHVEFLNRNHHLDKKMQHDYLFYSVSKVRRYKPWLKKSDKEKNDNKLIADVASVIGYNFQRTKQFWKTLNPDQQKTFLEKYIYPDMKNNSK